MYQVKAKKIASRTATFLIKASKEQLRVHIEVWEIPYPESKKFPDGLKFSIVAFIENNTSDAVVVDCHPPKGPHFHFEGKETQFEWKGLEEAEELFWDLVEKKFGKIEEV
jgi:hypothetical protein